MCEGCIKGQSSSWTNLQRNIRDKKVLEQVQQRAVKMMINLTSKNNVRLEELALTSLEERRRKSTGS